AICSWEQVREVAAAGVSVQSHGATHRTFSELSDEDICREVRESKAAIEAEVAGRVELLAYPYDDAGRSPESTDAILRGAGYKAAFHFVGGAAHWPPGNPFHLSRIPVWPDSDFSKGLTDQADRR